MTTKTLTIGTLLLAVIFGFNLTALAAPVDGAQTPIVPQAVQQVAFQQALAARFEVPIGMIQGVWAQAQTQAQQSEARPMNIDQIVITLLAEQLNLPVAEISLIFNEVHLAVLGTSNTAQGANFSTRGQPGVSGNNSANARMTPQGRSPGKNKGHHGWMGGRSQGMRGNSRNSGSNNSTNNSGCRR